MTETRKQTPTEFLEWVMGKAEARHEGGQTVLMADRVSAATVLLQLKPVDYNADEIRRILKAEGLIGGVCKHCGKSQDDERATNDAD